LAKANKPGELFTVTLGVGFVIGVLAGAAIWIDLKFPALEKQIAFVVSVVAAGGALYAAYYVGEGLHLQVENDRRRAAMELRHRSFEFISKLDATKWERVKAFISKEIADHNPTPPEREVYHKITAEAGLAADVTEILGLFEDMSIGIQVGYADEQVLYDSMRFVVQHGFGSLFPYVEQSRKSFHDPSLFSEAQKLFDAWSDHKPLILHIS